jgi:hypothetical protein
MAYFDVYDQQVMRGSYIGIRVKPLTGRAQGFLRLLKVEITVNITDGYMRKNLRGN